MEAKFGQLLREFRGRANKSMGDLSRFLGVSVTFISDVERGVRTPFTADKIMRLSSFLNLNQREISDLLHAGAQWRGVYELEVGATPEHQAAGTALMRGWSSLTEEQLKSIAAIVAQEQN